MCSENEDLDPDPDRQIFHTMDLDPHQQIFQTLDLDPGPHEIDADLNPGNAQRAHMKPKTHSA